MSEQKTAADSLKESWGPRLRDSRAAKETAALVHEQTVRDAYEAGMKVSWIRDELGLKDRTGIVRALRADRLAPEDAAAIAEPVLPVHVYLRAPGFGEGFWTRMLATLHARGWRVVRNEQEAWYLSRAGAVMVHVDVAALLDDDPVTVALMQAVEAQPAEQPSYAVEELLPVSAGISLERAFPGASKHRVAVQTTERRWKRLAGGERPRPTRYDAEATNNLGTKGAHGIDEQVIARWVADLL
ncbi:hypothetical protein [Streptomyces salinarius]|uniref:hypothetical protein n=1 Tax=Streptomyces salinarius TaxID=2762598 RepID=UPI0016482BF7|nr:hypothetical protein [Streptomyces salinarius]